MSQVQETAEVQVRPSGAGALNRFGSLFSEHQRIWTCVLVAAGFLVRTLYATGTFLNPDEAMHFAAANQNSWWLTYQASLRLAHPPLLIFWLHVWRHLGTSELMLRLPSILAGTAFCWFTFRWMCLLFEPAVAWSAFIFVLFLPPAIQLSAEVRQYALLLAFQMGSAYLFELALGKRSVSAMLFSGVCAWLALLSHFSAVLLAAALGIYAISILVRARLPLRLFAVWGVGQVVAIGLSYFLYVTQIVSLEKFYGGFTLTQGFQESAHLAKYYFDPSKTHAILFIVARTGGLFQFIFRQLVVGDAALPLFLIGNVMLVRNRNFARGNSRRIAFLLIVPFAVNCVAALFRAYPYGGTRHCAFLLPFAIAAVSVALTWILRGSITATVSVAVLVAALCNLVPAKQFVEAPSGAPRIANMKAALRFINGEVKPSEPIFTDLQTSSLLNYYLCEQHNPGANSVTPDFLVYACGGRKVIVARHQYVFTPTGFAQHWEKMIRDYHLTSGSRVWILEMGWGTHLSRELAGSQEMHLAAHEFGSEIQILGLTAGQRIPNLNLPPKS